MFNKLRIGTKLFLGFGVVIALLLILTAVMIYSYSTIEASKGTMLTLYSRYQEITHDVSEIQQMRRDFLVYLRTGDSAESKNFDRLLAQSIDAFTTIKATFTDPENLENAEIVLNALGDLQGLKSRYNALEGIAIGLRDQCSVIADKVRNDLEELVAEIVEFAKQVAVFDNVAVEYVEISTVKLELLLMFSRVDVSQVLSDRDNFVNSTADADRARYREQLFRNMKKLAKDLDEIKPLMLPEFADRFDQIMSNRVAWERIAVGYVQNVEEVRSIHEPILADIRQIIRASEAVLNRTSEMVAAEGVALTATVENSRSVALVVSTLAVLIAIAMGWLLTKSVAGGIAGVNAVFHKITDEGDVNVTVDDAYLVRGDEVGDLARQARGIISEFRTVVEMGQAVSHGDWTYTMKVKSDKDEMNLNMNRMVELVSATLREIEEGVKQVATGSGEVTSAAQSLSSGAQEAAASLEEISASMHEISSQTKTNAESAGQARDLAKLASKAATDGQGAMQSMTEAMKRITNNSSEIQRVIKVIDDIAFQTNLLALNAAVEAARAGQHGKGFAVVAEEVRNLASRSAKAAQETSELIAKSGQEIEKGDEVATHTAEVLNTIVDQIKQTTDLVAGIAIASNEQAQGVNQVSIGLQQIDAVTQQNTAAAEESASAASEMSGMAASLQQRVAQFKLR